MSKRILIIASKFPYPENDGGAIATMSMVRGFHRAGHEVTLFAMNTYKHYVDLDLLPKEIKQLARFYASDVDIRLNPGKALRNLFFSEKAYHIERFTSEPFADQLKHLLKLQNKPFDLIQLEGLYVCPYIELLQEVLPQTPIVFRPHNIEHEIWERQWEQAKQGLRKYYLKITAERIKEYEELQLRNPVFKAIIPISSKDAGMIQKLRIRTPIHVSTAAFDLKKLAKVPPTKMQAKSLCYIGALDWLPNELGMKWFLKKVWPAIHKMYPEVELFIAGRRMSPFFSTLKMEGITVVGEVKDAYTYMRSKAIMIVPLFIGSGMRVKIIEGMALGKAILATSIAAEGIPARHGYDIMIADEPETFINQLATLIENPSMVSALGEHAATLIHEQFDNEKIVKELLEFYEKTVF
jgi:glycosyltransferase involved in cell wall biosynthesis